MTGNTEFFVRQIRILLVLICFAYYRQLTVWQKQFTKKRSWRLSEFSVPCFTITTADRNEFVAFYVSRVYTGRIKLFLSAFFDLLTSNGPYRGRTAPLTSKRCILYICSTNICTEYFKRGICSPFFSLQNAVCFIILTYLVPVLFTFYIQVC